MNILVIDDHALFREGLKFLLRSLDAALHVDATRPAEIADAILRLASDAELRESLRAKGKKRARLFDWRVTATLTLRAFRSVLDKRGEA